MYPRLKDKFRETKKELIFSRGSQVRETRDCARKLGEVARSHTWAPVYYPSKSKGLLRTYVNRFTCIKFSFLLERIFLSPIVLIVLKKNGPIRMQYLNVCQVGSDGS